MASGAADPAAGHGDATLRAGWDRLDRAARAAAAAAATWKARAFDAEAQVQRLRGELEAVSQSAPPDGDAAAPASDELRRLRAENALLTSRAAEARQRLSALLSRLAVLEARR
jgi:hypothetical protein